MEGYYCDMCGKPFPGNPFNKKIYLGCSDFIGQDGFIAVHIYNSARKEYDLCKTCVLELLVKL